jgi:tetratricopeptide (TPR) repeat protein
VGLLAAAGYADEARREAEAIRNPEDRTAALLVLAQKAKDSPDHGRALYEAALQGQLLRGELDLIAGSLAAGVDHQRVDAFIKARVSDHDRPNVAAWAADRLAKEGHIADALWLANAHGGGYALVKVAEAMGDTPQAYDTLRRAEAIAPPDELFGGRPYMFAPENLPSAYAAIGKYDDALRIAGDDLGARPVVARHMALRGEIARAAATAPEGIPSIAADLVKAKRLDDALKLAALMPDGSPRIVTLAKVAIALDQAQRRGDAHRVLADAEPAARTQRSIASAIALGTAWTATAQPERAVAIFREAAGWPGSYGSTICDLAEAEARNGFDAEAEALAAAADCRSVVATAFLENGHLEAALRTAPIESDVAASVHARFVEIAAEKGDVRVILAAAAPLTDLNERSHALIGAGKKLCDSARVAAAEELLDRLEKDIYDIGELKKAIVVAWAKAGDDRRALTAADRLAQPGEQACAIATAAQVLAARAAGAPSVQRVGTLAVARLPKDSEYDTEKAAKCVVEALSGAGAVDLALPIARSFRADRDRDELLQTLAMDLIKRREYRRALNLAGDATSAWTKRQIQNGVITAAYALKP